MQTHLPQWVPLFREKLEVSVCELQGRERVQFQVGPRMKEGGQVDKGVKTQSIIAIVREVGHKYTDLETVKNEVNTREYVLILFSKIVIKSKAYFPSLAKTARAVNLITAVVAAVENKQIISQSATVLKLLTVVGSCPPRTNICLRSQCDTFTFVM